MTRFGLIERKKEKGRVLSKGLKQRLMICMALVGDPKILFLDEPTSGLDVVSARLIRQLIEEINKEKETTVFLTTHNMQEAEQLRGRVAIMNKGRIAAIARPEVLQETVESTRAVEISFKETDSFAESFNLFKKALHRETHEQLWLFQAKTALVVTMKNIRVYYLKPPVLIFGIIFPIIPLAIIYIITRSSLTAPLIYAAGIVTGSLLFAALGVLLSAPSTESPSQIMMLSNLVRLPLIFISGVFIPIQDMPEWGKWIEPFSPLTYVSVLMRVSFGESGYFPVYIDFIAICAFSVLFFACALFFHKRTGKKGM